jgi:chorismate synthase
VELLSGVLGGKATGAPLALWIRNRDADSRPYAQPVARPGHGDWTQWVATGGHADLRGGGHLSGRLNAPLVAAGAVAQAILDPLGIACAAHLAGVGATAGPLAGIPARTMRSEAAGSPLCTAHRALEPALLAELEAAARGQDSVGGLVGFAADGLPAGLGDPFFDGVESRLAHLLFSIPAVKAVGFGAGWAAAGMRGSAHNDPFEGPGAFAKNDAGGILGGRTSGATLWGHVAVKPTSTLPGRRQAALDLATGAAVERDAGGRHDPCIAIRAVPAVEACLQLVLADLALHGRGLGIIPAPARAASPT